MILPRSSLSALGLVAFILLHSVFGPGASAGQLAPALEQELSRALPDQEIRVIIYLKDQVDLRQTEQLLRESYSTGTKVIPAEVRYQTILSALQSVAEQTQPLVLPRLAAMETKGAVRNMKRFWIRNMIVTGATPRTIRAIASWPEVETVYLDGLLQREVPVSSATGSPNPDGSETGLRLVNAHRLWALGYTGAGRLVMNIDTGVEGDNLALQYKWRGTLPGVQPTWAWHDPSGRTTYPGDGDNVDQHGTHTMGIMCGLYRSTNDTLGIAPGALWIASNSLIGGNPHTSRTLEAFQWAANPDSNFSTMTDVPDVVSCSWFDPNVGPTECTTGSGYWSAIDALEALGTAVVFSAGNSGPSASSITAPKNYIATPVNSFAVGAVSGVTGFPIASFSSRGPSVCAGPDSLRIKPEVVAPGVDVRSVAGVNGFRVLSGTSMAAPHVAGAIALLREAAPYLTGTEIKYLLLNNATDLGIEGDDNTYGRGIIDIWKAYQAIGDPDDPAPPSGIEAYSDFTTPTSVLLTWTNPMTTVGGDPIGPFAIRVFRDTMTVAEVPSTSTSFSDTGLTTYSEYRYQLQAHLLANDSLSVPARVSATAGGSPTPSPPVFDSLSTNETEARLRWTNPTTQSDGTPIHDFSGVVIFRDGSPIDSVGPAVTLYTDTPPTGSTYSYFLRARNSLAPPRYSLPSASRQGFVGTTPGFLIWQPSNVVSGSANSIALSLADLGEGFAIVDSLFAFGDNLTVFEGIFAVMGVFNQNHIILQTDPEGSALHQYVQNGGNLYLEGGDVFNYDPEQGGYQFRQIFGLNDGSDGEAASDIPGVLGHTIFAGLSFRYTGHDLYMDELHPVEGNGLRILFTVPGSITPVDTVAVYNVFGNGRVIGSVPSFTGLVDSMSNTKDSLMARMLRFFRETLNPPDISVTPLAIAETLQVGQPGMRRLSITNTTLPPSAPLVVSLSGFAPWLSISPQADTLAGLEETGINVTFITSGLAIGSYSSAITISSNDQDEPSVDVPVTLEITGSPSLALSQDSLMQVLSVADTLVDTLIIRNEGIAPLLLKIRDVTPQPGPADNPVQRVQADVLYPPRLGRDGIPLSPRKGEIARYHGPGATEGKGGTDSSGYYWIDSDEPGGPVFNWTDISSPGTPITTWRGSPGTPNADDGYAIVSLPFSFPFYHRTYDSIKVVTNGWLSFNTASNNTEFENSAVPSTKEPNLVLFPWWDDLNMRTSGSVHYYHDTANDRFIVQFTQVPHFGTGEPGLYTFQVILNGDGTIVYQYNDMQQTLNSSTIGIENASGTDGIQVVFNSSYVHNGLAVLITNDVPWLAEEPSGAMIEPGDSIAVGVFFDSRGLNGGQYHATLEITSNDFTNTPARLPVTMRVTGAPAALLATPSIDFGQTFVADTVTGDLVVRSIGSDSLLLQGFSVLDGNRWFSVGRLPATVAPGDSLRRAIRFTPDAIGTFAGVLRFLTNDPDPSRDTIEVALTGIGARTPSASLSVTSVSKSLSAGIIDSSSSFQLINRGDSTLVWKLSEVIVQSEGRGPAAASPGGVNPGRPDDQSPVQMRFIEGLLALGDTLFSFDVTHLPQDSVTLQLGVEYALGHYWVTGGTSNAPGNKMLYKFDSEGTFVAAYPQGTATPFGWRDLAFDGQYLYASDENEFARIDPSTGLKVGTLPKPAGETVLRGLAFDPATRHFWTKNFDTGPLIEFDSTGTIIRSFSNPTVTYGLAWDRWSADGPYLWSWSQEGPQSGPACTAVQINPANGQLTGVSFVGHNYGPAEPNDDIAGGATISDEIDAERLLFVGLHQSVADRVVAYDMDVSVGLPWVKAGLIEGSLNAQDSLEIRVIFNTTGLNRPNYSGRFRISTNDPLHPELFVDLQLNVLGTGVDEGPGVPREYSLAQNYPNPFNPSTRIEYALPVASSVTLRVFNILGELVAEVFSGMQGPGYYTTTWGGRSSSGLPVSSGVYFYRLEGRSISLDRSFIYQRKMLLLK